MKSTFPRQDISETEKFADDQQFFKDCGDYAIHRFHENRKKRIFRIRRMYNGYNGISEDREFAHLNKTYGPDNMVKYIDYRLCRAKIDLIIGEQLQMPLNGTVYTTNPEARAQKLEDVSAIIGMHYAQPHVDKLRSLVNVDVFNGMPTPQVPEGKTIFETLPPKLRNEIIMQKIINRQIDDMKLRLKFNENMSDVTLTSECFGKCYINNEGEVDYRSIIPENAIFEESERDPFLDKSPYMGEQRIMFVHDIIREYNPSKEVITKLYERIGNPDLVMDSEYRDNYELLHGSLAIRVYTVEWIGIEKKYLKTYTDKDGEEREVEISSDYYDKNERRIQKEAKAGKYKISTGYKFVLYETTRAGHDIYLQMEKVKHMPASWSKPSWTLRRYCGLLFNTVGGVRISVKQLTEHLDRSYNMVMWQINRELAKAKGKVLVYDKAYLPKKKTIKAVMYNIVNDSLLVVDSSGEGNTSGKDAATLAGFKEVDLGVSNSINVLIPLKVNLEETADRITGILQNRMGQIAASSTAANAQQSIQASRTTTAPLFFYFNQYIERVMRLTCELSKISWGILKPEKGDMILGAEMMQYLRVTKNIIFDDYGYSLGDMSKEMRIRDIIRMYMPQVLNANPDLIADAIDAEIAETVTEAVGIVRSSLKRAHDLRMAEAQAQRDHEMQAVNAEGETQIAIQDGQNQKEVAIQGLKQVGKTAELTQKASNQAVVDRNKARVTPQQKRPGR